MPTETSDPAFWAFCILMAVLVALWIFLFFFPNGFDKKEQEYQKWIRGRTGETWDQKK